MSKILKRYNELKKQDNSKIYLFKIGIFYNIFNEDADLLSKALGLKITTLSSDLYKVGFPISKIEKYTKLLENKSIKFEIIDSIVKVNDNNEYIKIINSIEIVKKILNIDLNNTTFKQAFDILYDMQQQLKKMQ